jgi:hypothetical protein
MRTKWIAALVIFASVALFWSCAKEYSLEGVGPLPVAGGGGGGTGTGTGNRHCIACTYLPFCDSSEFVYLLNGIDTVPGLIHVLNDTLIGGQTYTKVSGFAAFNNGILYNCANQEYKAALPLAQFGLNADSITAALQPLLDSLLPIPGGGAPSISIPSTFYATILKANQPAGATWLDTLGTITVPVTAGPFTINLRIYVGIEYTYLEKNTTRTVLSNSFTNVQHVQGKPKTGLAGSLPIPLPLPLPTVNGQIDFYLAKDIGLAEMNASDSTGTLASAKLIRYRL